MTQGATDLISRLRAKQLNGTPGGASPPEGWGSQINPPENALPPAAPVGVATPPPAAVETPAPAAAPKRGRPAKSSAAERTLPLPGIAAAAQTTDATLYINCAPIGATGYVTAERIFDNARTDIAAVHELADYRFAEYGSGPGILAQTVRKLLAGDYANKDIVLDTHSAEAMATLSVFVSAFTKIIRGF